MAIYTEKYSERNDAGKARASSGNAVEVFLRQLKSGGSMDETTFQGVYDTVQRWFHSFLNVRDQEEYLDIIDEAFTKFFEHRESFRGASSGEFYAYMKMILRSIIDGKVKKGGRTAALPDDREIADTRAVTHRHVEKDLEMEALYGCIDVLAGPLRDIMYGILAGSPKGDIARSMAISPSLLSHHIKKAVKELRQCLTLKGYTAEVLFA